jgi:hypothetical protein
MKLGVALKQLDKSPLLTANAPNYLRPATLGDFATRSQAFFSQRAKKSACEVARAQYVAVFGCREQEKYCRVSSESPAKYSDIASGRLH